MSEVVDKTDDSNRARWFPMVCIVVVLFVVYALSYAPVVRLRRKNDRSIASMARRRVSGSIAVYRPVDWLIENTRLREPLWKWADVWGVRDDFDFFTRMERLGREVRALLERIDQKKRQDGTEVRRPAAP